jgi:hypothetical protein
MKNTTDLLKTSGQTVVFLFAMSGGVLNKVAPPDEVGTTFTLGIASFLTLIILLFITAVGQKASNRKPHEAWMIVGFSLIPIILGTFFIYRNLIDSHTYPDNKPIHERHVNAADSYLTDHPRAFKEQNPDATAQYLVDNFPDEQNIWQPKGLEKAKNELSLCYICLVLSIAGSVFCLLEATKSKSGGVTTPPAESH